MNAHPSLKKKLLIAGMVINWLFNGCATAPRTQASRELARLSPDERYEFISREMGKLVTGGRITNIRWSEDGSALHYTRGDERMKFDLVARKLSAVMEDSSENNDAESTRGRRGGRRGGVARGAQRDREVSPDGKWVALAKDWNVMIEPAGESNGEGDQTIEPIAVTTDGTRKFRYGKASWVYGEELDQTDAMWWSSDSTKLAFYEFDERQVPDHYLTAGLTDLHTTVLTEGYPKAGEPNPIANILVFDLETRKTIRVDVGNHQDQYIYNVRFSPNGDELLFNKTNRHQNVLDVVAANPETGETRVILTETQECWQDNSPEMQFLDDGKRFLWATEKSGWEHYELRDIDGKLLNTITHGEYPVNAILHVDEDKNVIYYTAYSDANPLNLQLHRVNLDGTNPKRLTHEPLNHAPRLSPDGKWFITTYEAADTPPTTALYSTEGERIATLAQSDTARFRDLGLPRPELVTFTAADGVTRLHGSLHKPSNFRSSTKYPLVIDVYGGPLSKGLQNRFSPAVAACEYGFLIAKLENRGTVSRGKRFETAAYLKLGVVDLDDQAAGVQQLSKRRYVDKNRVGIFGHSYGGYMSALALLRYPEVFHVAVAGGTVTDWRNYDTIYTERFMRTPQENPEGYDAGSCNKLAANLKGKLLLQHGMLDDNVHPSNAFQLIDALHKAKMGGFEMEFYPTAGHGIGPPASANRWVFLRKHLLEN